MIIFVSVCLSDHLELKQTDTDSSSLWFHTCHGSWLPVQAEMFLGLLFKALKSDINSDRMSAFAKRLTQVSYFSGFGFTICIIFQYLELLECALADSPWKHEPLGYMRTRSVLGIVPIFPIWGCSRFINNLILLGLVCNQVALHQPPQFACGCLLLLSEILKTRPSLWWVPFSA